MPAPEPIQRNAGNNPARHVYLDVCALCRPFDDQNQMRIRLETDAVALILSHVRSGELTLIISPVHQVEIAAISETDEREYMQTLLQEIGVHPPFDLAQAHPRTEQFVGQGMGGQTRPTSHWRNRPGPIL